MPYTAADLTTIYTNTQIGLVPTAAITQLLAAYAAQNANGSASDAQTLNAVLALANPTTAVAITTYQFFTGSVPTAAGLAFLVNSPANATDLNDPYYAQFNQSNRYINFAANLGTGVGAGASSFAAGYGALSFTDAVNVAYETIIGSGPAINAGFNPDAGKAYVVSQLSYFQAFARQNNPTATAAQLDLIVKAEAVGFILNEAVKSNLGNFATATRSLLADLGPDNAAILGSNLLTNYGSTSGGAVDLTANTDLVTANVFNAGLVFSPGGDVRLNSLQDEDQLTGVGTNPTLNFTFGNPSLNGSEVVTPVLNNIQTINIALSGSGNNAGGPNLVNPVLDVQDGTGINAVNVSRISDTQASVTVRNLVAEPASFSVNNTNAPAAVVQFLTTSNALAGAANATTVTFNNAVIRGFVNQAGNNQIGQGQANTAFGIETVNVVSTGGPNIVGQMQLPGLQTLNITGAGNLAIGTNNTGVVAAIGAGTQIEATNNQAGLIGVAGTLTTVNASTMTGALSFNLAAEAVSGQVQNSGQPLNFTFTGGTGNDTLRFTGAAGDSAADVFDGGAGVNTLALYPLNGPLTIGTVAATGTFRNFQNLDIRTGGDADLAAEAVTVNMATFPSINVITVRNEGQQTVNIGTPAVPVLQQISGAEQATFTFTNLSTVQGANLNVQHGTTGNSAIGQTTLVASLAANTAADTIGVALVAERNTETRNNLVINAGTAAGGALTVENITIYDQDAESNTVALGNIGAHSGLLYVTGGTAGTYMSFDSRFVGIVAPTTNLYRQNEGPSPLGAASGDGIGVADVVLGQAYRFLGTSFDSTTSLDNVTLRVTDSGAPNGAQTLRFGVGNDTVIFDTLNNNRAGLSISDVVAGGAGSDVLVLDGAAVPISIGASEWTNVTGWETLRLVGNTNAAGVVTGITSTFAGIQGDNRSNLASGFGAPAVAAGTSPINQYNITLTNDYITNNAAGGQVITIINDDDPNNDARGADTAGTGVETGVNIDARFLDALHGFTYNGEEGASRTADRFIMTDPNINGRSVIDGGAFFAGASPAYGTSNLANEDVLEVRNAAVVSAGDLAGISNIGTLQFTNDTATSQTSVLELTALIVDTLVNTTRVAAAGFIENLTVGAFNNTNVAGATTTVQMDIRAINTFETITLQGNGNFQITTASAAQNAQVINGPGFAGTVTFTVSPAPVAPASDAFVAAGTDVTHISTMGYTDGHADLFIG